MISQGNETTGEVENPHFNVEKPMTAGFPTRSNPLFETEIFVRRFLLGFGLPGRCFTQKKMVDLQVIQAVTFWFP